MHPIERINAFLWPIIPRALDKLGREWKDRLGANDGEELSTKLMLAAIQCMKSDLRPEARAEFNIKRGRLMMSKVLNLQKSITALARVERMKRTLRPYVHTYVATRRMKREPQWSKVAKCVEEKKTSRQPHRRSSLLRSWFSRRRSDVVVPQTTKPQLTAVELVDMDGDGSQ